ncbi:hypothetical protein YC2023_101870 [Brassica napus]
MKVSFTRLCKRKTIFVIILVFRVFSESTDLYFYPIKLLLHQLATWITTQRFFQKKHHLHRNSHVVASCGCSLTGSPLHLSSSVGVSGKEIESYHLPMSSSVCMLQRFYYEVWSSQSNLYIDRTDLHKSRTENLWTSSADNTKKERLRHEPQASRECFHGVSLRDSIKGPGIRSERYHSFESPNKVLLELRLSTTSGIRARFIDSRLEEERHMKKFPSET